MKNSTKSVIELLLRSLGWSAPLALAVVAMFLSGAEAPAFSGLCALLPLVGLAAIFASSDEGGGDDEEEDDESAQTIVAMPVWMIEEMAKKRQEAKEKQEALAKPQPEDIGTPSASEGPSSEPEAPAEEQPAVGAEEPTDEADLGVAQTMMFDPSEVAGAREEAAAAAPPAAEEDPGTAQTLMFDPGEAVKAQEEIVSARAEADEPATEEPAPEEPAPEPTPADDAIGETAVYSADEVARLREQAAAAADPEADGEVDGEARTMMYMPAAQDGADAPADAAAPPAEEPEDEGHAPTRVYMEAVTEDGGESTMAYSSEDREKLLEKMAKKGVDGAVAEEEQADDVDAGGATQVYSAEESAQFKDGYDLLRKPAETPETPEVPEAAEVPQTKTVTTPQMKRVEEPITVSAMEPVEPSGGIGAGTVIFLLALLAVAGAATAVILHLLGIVELPLDLPKLDL